MTGATASVTGARKAYGGVAALDGVSLFAHGGVTTLLGPNGAGKTTLLRALGTVHTLDDGVIQIDGMSPLRPAERTEIRRRLGYLPQEPGFNPSSTVFDVVDYVAVLKGQHDRRRRHLDVRRALEEVDLSARAGDRVRELSGGMRRRLGLAQALLGHPRFVVLDEPAAGLDPQQRLILRELISRLGARSTVVLSTHLTDEAAAVSQNLLVLVHGRVLFEGTPTGLAETARGRVWLDDRAPATSANLGWRTPNGRWRCVGEPPPGVELDEPTLEDAYLLMVGRDALESAAA